MAGAGSRLLMSMTNFPCESQRRYQSANVFLLLAMRSGLGLDIWSTAQSIKLKCGPTRRRGPVSGMFCTPITLTR